MMPERFQKIAEQVASTTSFITSRSQLLRSPTKRSTTMPRCLASVYPERTITIYDDLYPKFISPILSLSPRERERDQFRGRRRQSILCTYFEEMRFIKCKLNTQVNTCYNFLDRPNRSMANKIVRFNEIMYTDCRCG